MLEDEKGRKRMESMQAESRADYEKTTREKRHTAESLSWSESIGHVIHVTRVNIDCSSRFSVTL